MARWCEFLCILNSFFIERKSTSNLCFKPRKRFLKTFGDQESISKMPLLEISSLSTNQSEICVIMSPISDSIFPSFSISLLSSKSNSFDSKSDKLFCSSELFSSCCGARLQNTKKWLLEISLY